ncbi:hypothetical protein Tco_1229151 [Tanacetum coccineum]
MTKSKSFNKHPKHITLYHALMESILADKDAMDQGVAENQKKRKLDNKDRGKDPFAGPDQGLKKRTMSKDAEPPKRPKSTGSSKDTTRSQPKSTLGPVYNLLKGTCKRCMELEYNMKECYRALSDQLDWNNPEGNHCPYDLSKPIPLQEIRGRLSVPVDFFFNNDLEYLRGGSIDRNPIKVAYDKYAALGVFYWGPKRQRFYGYMINQKFRHDVYSTMRILSVISVTTKKWYGYGYLKEIVVRRADQKLYKLMEGDFHWLHLNDIEDMLLLVVQNKLNNLDDDVIIHLAVGLHMRTRRIIIQAPYTTLLDLQRVIYEDKRKRKIQMRTEELYKFSDGTLTSVRNTLDQMLKNLRLGYNKDMKRRKWSATDKRRTRIMIKDINQQFLHRSIMRSLEKFVSKRDYETDYRLLQRTSVRLCLVGSLIQCYLLGDALVMRMGIQMVAAAGPRQVRFIATCSYSTDICKDIMEAQIHVSKDFHYSDTTRLP